MTFIIESFISANFLSLCMWKVYNFLRSRLADMPSCVNCFLAVLLVVPRGYDRGQGLVAEWHALSNLASCPASSRMLAWGSDPVISVVIETTTIQKLQIHISDLSAGVDVSCLVIILTEYVGGEWLHRAYVQYQKLMCNLPSLHHTPEWKDACVKWFFI